MDADNRVFRHPRSAQRLSQQPYCAACNGRNQRVRNELGEQIFCFCLLCWRSIRFIDLLPQCLKAMQDILVYSVLVASRNIVGIVECEGLHD